MTMTNFLSHSTQDKEVVAAIADAVQGQGLQAWMDVRQLTAGDELEPAIRRPSNKRPSSWSCSAPARWNRTGCGKKSKLPGPLPPAAKTATS